MGKGIQMVLGGETYLDDIESREHAPMGLAVLRNCSDGGPSSHVRTKNAARRLLGLFRRGA